jgi:hypothetical protein
MTNTVAAKAILKRLMILLPLGYDASGINRHGLYGPTGLLCQSAAFESGHWQSEPENVTTTLVLSQPFSCRIADTLQERFVFDVTAGPAQFEAISATFHELARQCA